MTFIASVIAKDGVAIIADSLVTTSSYVIDIQTFREYVKSKDIDNTSGQISLDMKEVSGLFKLKPSHTKDYEDKLIQYDQYTVITTAGNATINDFHIGEIVEQKKQLNGQNDIFLNLNFNEKIEDFCTYLTNHIKEHLANYSRIDPTIFIFTHFAQYENKTIIYKVETSQASDNDLDNPDFIYVPIPDAPEPLRVVSEGQNRLTEKILIGGLGTIYDIVPKVIEKVASDFMITDRITAEYLRSTADFFVTSDVLEEVNVIQLTELSLQQAVELASLLMKIEIAFQKYTKNIPTVGGVVKVAIINKDGYKLLIGNEIKTDIV